MSGDNLTEDELANLSEEERDAIEQDDSAGDDDEAEEIQGEDDSETGDEAEEDAGEASEAGEEEAASADADAADDESVDDDSADADDGKVAASDDPTFTPKYEAKLPENYQDQVDTLNKERGELMETYKNGDLDVEDMLEQRDAIDAKLRGLHDVKLKVEIAEEQNNQTAEQRWKHEQDSFFGRENSKIYEDTVMFAALDQKVRELGNEHPEKSGLWVLEEADKYIRSKFNLTSVEDTGDKGGDKKPDGSRKPDLTSVPKTLGDIPAAETNTAGDNKFAHLDKLTGLEFENALAQLSEADQEQYLRQA